MNPRKALLLIPAVAALLLPSSLLAAERSLDLKEAQREEVRHSMIGPRDTLVFYSFGGAQAVMVLQVRNADATFPVSAKLHLFDPKTTAEDLAKWVNNQHSDGLFPDIPEPVESIDLPEGTCLVTAKKLVEEKKQGPMNETFQDYQLTIAVKARKVGGKFDLKAFEDKVGVFLKVTES